MNIRYVSLAYGESGAIYRQASVLLLSLLAYAPEPRELVVVSDHPERFEWFVPLARVHALTSETLAAWRGPNPFSMRQKLEAARALAPAHGALVLLDADTIANADLDGLVAALASGALLLHRREFELGVSRRRGNRALWERLRGRRFAGWEFRADDAMWNSGVLALPAADVTLLDQALSLYDAMADAGIRHFATEQLVAGLVFERSGRLRSAERWFTHYWGNKKNFEAEIERRLADAHSRRLTPRQAAEELRSNPIRLPPEIRPSRWEKVQRWLGTRIKAD